MKSKKEYQIDFSIISSIKRNTNKFQVYHIFGLISIVDFITIIE